MDSAHLATVTVIITLVIVLAWEMLWPRRPPHKGMVRRWTNNLTLTFIGQLTAHGTKALSLVLMAWLAQSWGFGLFADAQGPWILAFVVYMLALESVGYGMHLALHKVPWMWRIHRVHHSDTELDFSSSYRHHPFEILLMYGASLPVVILLAPPVSVVLAYAVVRTAVHVPGHANIYIPEKVDRILRKFLITPDFHRLHHCSDRRYTDSNYGTILPWFDYLFGTYQDRPFADQATMEIGLEYARAPIDSRVDHLLWMPFRRFDSDAVEAKPLLGTD